jgi:hypothetical protein
VYHVKDWAEVHRLFHRERWTKAAIADKPAMSRNTVNRLLTLSEPPHYRQPCLSVMLWPCAITELAKGRRVRSGGLSCRQVRSDCSGQASRIFFAAFRLR